MKFYLKNIMLLTSLTLIFFSNAFGEEELLGKTFKKIEGENEIGEINTKECTKGARCISQKFATRDGNAINNLDQQKNIYQQIMNDKYIQQYKNGSKTSMPFAQGNDDSKVKLQTVFDDEDSYIRNEEIKMCNKELNNNVEPKYTVDELLAPGIPEYLVPCIAAKWVHNGTTTNEDNVKGLFEHESHGLVGGCFEYHKVSDYGKQQGLRVVGTYSVTFDNPNAVPLCYRFSDCIATSCPKWKPPCTIWTIMADKIEYYFPTKKVTLSTAPLYTRYIKSEDIQKIFSEFEEAVKEEMKSSSMSSKTAKTHLKSKQASEGTTSSSSNNNSSNVKVTSIQPSEVPKETFLGQINRGYGRYFKLEDIETDWLKANGPEETKVLPHISAGNKKYWGTDYKNKNADTEPDTDLSFFDEENNKQNLAYFINPGSNYIKTILKNKHNDHIKNPWKILKENTLGGGSITQYQSYYEGIGAKAFKEVIPKDKNIETTSLKESNDYRNNTISYGIGNISNLMSLTPTGNSDYILSSLVRTHNMFLEELNPRNRDDEQMGTSSTSDPQLKNNANVITKPGLFFSITDVTNSDERQSFKTKWDIFHCPIADYEDKKAGDVPRLFNKYFNKDMDNIMTNKEGANENTVISQKGETCFKYEDMLRNNLDFNMINSIREKYGNVDTISNKGEISFTIYTLFSGTVGVPGQGYPFWKNGTGHIVGKGTGVIPDTKSKADPIIQKDEFRLY